MRFNLWLHRVSRFVQQPALRRARLWLPRQQKSAPTLQWTSARIFRIGSPRRRRLPSLQLEPELLLLLLGPGLVLLLLLLGLVRQSQYPCRMDRLFQGSLYNTWRYVIL